MKAEQSIAPTVGLRITPTVERDYTRRNVFPSLRAGLAIMREGVNGIFNVTIEEAERILADAKVQRLDATLPRGTPKAYTGLVGHLERTLREAKGEPPLVNAAQNLRPNASAKALLKEQLSSCDFYVGTAEQLIAAGLALADMFPGQPGCGKVQCSYPIFERRRRLVISSSSKGRFVVEWPVDEDEKKRRDEKKAAERASHRPEQAASTRVQFRTDDQVQLVVGLGNAFSLAHEASPAKFNVGDEAIEWNVEEVVEVIGGYGWYHVKDAGHKLGYVIRYPDGYESFAPAHLLLETKTNRVRHLRLVETTPRAGREAV